MIFFIFVFSFSFILHPPFVDMVDDCCMSFLHTYNKVSLFHMKDTSLPYNLCTSFLPLQFFNAFLLSNVIILLCFHKYE